MALQTYSYSFQLNPSRSITPGIVYDYAPKISYSVKSDIARKNRLGNIKKIIETLK